ncbi:MULTISPECIES: carbohydrate kinase family protein [Rhodomicrobium]|uniref:carbohydrate kinase family protein n=1 Tax=Rhodomicrobium TaxID=1068 RepID=UPI000B4BB4C0|nr:MULTISPECIES: carbohydrate kinase family protein [Rhodomicrobium]
MKALTVGGAMVDSIAIINSGGIERMSMRNADASFLLLEEGRKIEAEEISTYPGGGAVNAAVSMARLGLDVSAIVKLGTDQRADSILGKLEKEGVSTRWVTRDPRLPTGASVVISSHERNAAIFTFRGANTLLAIEDIKREALSVDIVCISSLSNQSADCFPDLVKAAKAAGCKVAANPGIRQLTARGRAFLDTVGSIDILVVNRAEANALVPVLTGMAGEGGPSLPFDPDQPVPDLIRRGFSSGGFEISLVRFLQALMKEGAGMVVVTDGRQGAFVGTAGTVLHCPAAATEVLGTAGAGDAFASTFVALTSLGWPLDAALKAATLNSASVVRHADTQTGLLKLAELEEAVAREKGLQVRDWPMRAA